MTPAATDSPGPEPPAGREDVRILPGEAVIGLQIADGVSRFAEGFIQRRGGLDSVRVRGDRRTAEMVAEPPG